MKYEILPWLTLFLPIFSAAAITLFTLKNRNVSALLSVGAIVAGFVMTLVFIGANGFHINIETPGLGHAGNWLSIGDLQIDFGLKLDALSLMMMLIVTGVGGAIHIYAVGYMREDSGFSRFFACLSLFTFSMLGIVLANNFIEMFIFWELVGVSSYLLIGFWFEKPSAADAAKKAFFTNRLGDFGFLLGILVVWTTLGSLNFSTLQQILAANPAALGTLASIAGLLIFCGAMGKSAQFPLHVWLPDAMEGPTPVSALIHAATMVAAGVYLVARLFPILTPDAKLFIAVIGATTLTMAALIAIVQTDIKKVLAYSTLSQLGYMILAMGVGSWIGGLFHLITHAFFKALLFLGSGSVIFAAHHEQEMPKYGGLFRKIPVTAITFLIAVFAISGVGLGPVGFSGFYSKDMILAHAGSFAMLASNLGKSKAYYLLFALPTIIAYVTPFYMMRCWMMTFWGKPRDAHVYEHAHEVPTMWGPLVVLAILAIISGRFMNVQEMVEGSIKENNAYCRLVDNGFKGFDTAWPGTVVEQKGLEARDMAETPPGTPRVARHAPDTGLTETERAHVHGHEMVDKWLNFAGFTSGIALAFLVYMNGLGFADFMLKIPPVRWIRTCLYHRMYFDELYHSVFVEPVVSFSRFCAWFDRFIIDGIVNGAAGG